MSELLLRAGTWDELTPETASWAHLSFSVRRAPFSAGTDADEIALVVLGGRCTVRTSDHGSTFSLLLPGFEREPGRLEPAPAAAVLPARA